MRRLLLCMLGMLLITGQLLAQNRTITGRVTDEKGEPVPNASVLVRGTNIGTTADRDGRFSISVPSTAKTLVFSAVNMGEVQVTIGNQTTINPTMRSTDNTLGGVVITGYTSRRRQEFTGSDTKVEAKKLEQLPLASFEQMLQGQAPGVYVASGSGQPGSSARVNIRGVGSFGNVDPLYVVDGVPIETNVFRTLNPNDFESIDVLKDAAGAGLYGSRGANGVVVITTKRGRSGRTNITYRGQAGVAKAPDLTNLRLMNTAERLQYEEQVLGGPAGILGSGTGITGYPGWDYSPNNPRYLTLTPAQRATEAALLDSIKQINTDWAGLFFRNAKFQQHEVNASGGNDKLNYYTSLSYYKQEGVIIRSLLERYTFRSNLDFKTDRLSVSVRSSAGFSKLSNIESEAGVALANPVAAAFLELPYRRAFTPAGKVAAGSGNTGSNAYDRLFTTTQQTNQFKGDLSISAQFDIWGGISFKTTDGVDWRNNNSSRFIDPNSYAGTLVANGAQGSYSEGNAENLQLISTTGLAFSRTFATKHQINAQAMVEAIRNRFRSNSYVGYGINPRILNSPAGITPGSATNNMIPTVGGSRTLNGLFSEFLIADYTYDRRYTISGSLRNDAPSQVPAKNRTNIFWTAGFSWNVSSEKFMSDQNIVQDVRLRGSYGEVANVNGLASDFGYISTYGSGSYAGVPAIVPTSPGNEDYKLESQLIKNIGLEFALWNRRVRTTLDYYVKDSRNLFLSQQLTRTTGFTSLSINAGKMRNQGFEFDLRVDAVKSKDLLVTLGVNGATLKNRITSLGQINEIAAGTGISRVGLPYGTHFAVGFLGVDPQSGLPVYEDINGNPTTVYSAANSRATYGTYLPKFTGGASLDASWKGISLSVLFHTAQGVKRFNNESFFYETTNSNTAFNKRVEMLSSWTKPGDITNFQRINSARQFSSRDIQDASFVRLRHIALGYTYNFKNAKYIRGIRLFAQGENLYTWTKWQGFDPEESNNIATYEFPNPKTYTVGIDVNF